MYLGNSSRCLQNEYVCVFKIETAFQEVVNMVSVTIISQGMFWKILNDYFDAMKLVSILWNGGNGCGFSHLHYVNEH